MDNSITREHLLQAAFWVARVYAPQISNLEMNYQLYEQLVVKEAIRADAERLKLQSGSGH